MISEDACILMRLVDARELLYFGVSLMASIASIYFILRMLNWLQVIDAYSLSLSPHYATPGIWLHY